MSLDELAKLSYHNLTVRVRLLFVVDTMHKVGKALVTNSCPLNAHLLAPSEKLHCMTKCASEGGRIWSALSQKSSQHRGRGLESKQVDLPISANCPIRKRAMPAEQRPVWISCMKCNALQQKHLCCMISDLQNSMSQAIQHV
jgi:hypothetical protein